MRLRRIRLRRSYLESRPPHEWPAFYRDGFSERDFFDFQVFLAPDSPIGAMVSAEVVGPYVATVHLTYADDLRRPLRPGEVVVHQRPQGLWS